MWYFPQHIFVRPFLCSIVGSIVGSHFARLNFFQEISNDLTVRRVLNNLMWRQCFVLVLGLIRLQVGENRFVLLIYFFFILEVSM